MKATKLYAGVLIKSMENVCINRKPILFKKIGNRYYDASNIDSVFDYFSDSYYTIKPKKGNNGLTYNVDKDSLIRFNVNREEISTTDVENYKLLVRNMVKNKNKNK